MHLLTAVTQALVAKSEGTLKTKTVHSEVLWCLEPGSNITDSLKHFGLNAMTTSLALVRIDSTGSDAATSVLQRMSQLVATEAVSLDFLGQLPNDGTNVKALRKIYKLNNDPVLKGVDQSTTQARQILDKLCTSAVALKTASA
ncbi:hypothetical protein ACM66B_002982 [Microbotryomycetes sp. NB124-2]